MLTGLTSAPRTIYVNMAKDVPWRDARVRQAVSKTIDRQVIIDNVYAGDAQFTGPIPPGYGDWPLSPDELAEHYTVDVEGAKALMEEAGLADGFPVTMIAISAPREYTQIAEIIAEQLKQINIDVTVEPQEIDTFVESINSEFDWASTGGGMRGDPSGYFVQFRSSDEGSYPIYYGDGWKSDKLDQLYDEALATTDQAARHDLYQQLQKLVLEENPYLYTVQPLKFQIVNKRITGMYVAYTDFNTGLRFACAAESYVAVQRPQHLCRPSSQRIGMHPWVHAEVRLATLAIEIGENMKITDVETISFSGGTSYPYAIVVVLVRTDEGLTGIGEASLGGRSRGVIGIIDHARELLVGQDPARIEHLYAEILRELFGRPAR